MRAISFAAIAQPAFLADSWKAAPKLFLLQPAQPAVLADSWIAAQSMAYPFLTFWITFSQRRGKRERCPACCFDPWVVSVSCGWASLSEAFFRESKVLFLVEARCWNRSSFFHWLPLELVQSDVFAFHCFYP